MKHYGDITKLSGRDLPPVDIITGGSPCQDLSVAGKRAGLAGERSGLFMEQIRIVKEMRERGNSDGSVRPGRYMVWENVPGALSSNGGEDFRAVLEETAKVAQPDAVIPEPPKGKWSNSGAIVGNGWSIAWRIHDAQYWGVPQRRKRIALLADFDGYTAPRIMFDPQLRGETERGDANETVPDSRTESRSEVQPECEGLPGDSESCGEEGEGTAGGTEDRAGETGGAVISFQEREGSPGGGKGILIQSDRIGALRTANNQKIVQPQTIPTGLNREQRGGETTYDMMPTPQAAADESGNNKPMAMTTSHVLPIHDQATRFSGKRGNHQDGKGNGLGVGHELDPSFTLSAADHHAVFVDTSHADDVVRTGETVSSLQDRDYKGGKLVAYNNYSQNTDPQPIAYGIDTYNQVTTGDVTSSLTSTRADCQHVPCVSYDDT